MNHNLPWNRAIGYILCNQWGAAHKDQHDPQHPVDRLYVMKRLVKQVRLFMYEKLNTKSFSFLKKKYSNALISFLPFHLSTNLYLSSHLSIYLQSISILQYIYLFFIYLYSTYLSLYILHYHSLSSNITSIYFLSSNITSICLYNYILPIRFYLITFYLFCTWSLISWIVGHSGHFSLGSKLSGISATPSRILWIYFFLLIINVNYSW